MKTTLQILFLVYLGTFGFASCTKKEMMEAHFMGVWRINKYLVEGHDQTYNYVQAHQEYSLYIKPDHVYVESWIDNTGPKTFSGSWEISDHGKSIELDDDYVGHRKFDLNYMYTLRYKAGKQELILRKI